VKKSEAAKNRFRELFITNGRILGFGAVCQLSHSFSLTAAATLDSPAG
jgi:hypothetical protein